MFVSAKKPTSPNICEATARVASNYFSSVATNSSIATEFTANMAPLTKTTPQILHLHDWPAALVPVYVRAHRLPFVTVLTIHHIAEQGSFWGLDFRLTNL